MWGAMVFAFGVVLAVDLTSTSRFGDTKIFLHLRLSAVDDRAAGISEKISSNWTRRCFTLTRWLG
jgi:hypothetical protein